MRVAWLVSVAVLWLGFVDVPSPARAGPPRPATPDEIRAWIAKAGDAKAHGKAPFVVVLDEADIVVHDSGLATTTSCRVVKILTDGGVRSHAVLREGFDPATNRVAIDAVLIHRKDGSLEEVDVAKVVTPPRRQGSIFWGGKQHLLDLPRLEVGDALEVRTQRIGFNIAYLSGREGELSGEGLEPPMPGHWYEVVRFEERQPILRKRYSVHLPAEKPLQFAVTNGTLRSSLRFVGDRHVYTFEAEDIAAVKREPAMAPWDDCVTKVVMATLPDWESKSRWFHEVNEGQFEADEAIRAKVAEITKGLPDDEAKIRALHHWVSDNIRYVGTSRGPCEGYTLHDGRETFRDRAGVCKDIAGMLITMLRVQGFEAYPALTMAGPRVEDVPADQFNHTICVMRNPDGSFRVLDPTWSPRSREIWSSREAEQGLVYGTPEGQGLTLSPFFAPEMNLVHVTSDASIDEEGTLATTLTYRLKGYGCTYLRRSLHRHPPDRVRGAIESALAIGPTARLGPVAFTDPLDYSTDSTATLDVTAARYAAAGEDTLLLRLPLLRHPLGKWLIPDLLDPPKGKERRYALRLRASRLVRYEETIRLPEGWTVAHRPKDRNVESAAAHLVFAAKTEGNALTYSLELRAKRHLIPAEDVAGLRKALEALKAVAGEWVVLRKEGAK